MAQSEISSNTTIGSISRWGNARGVRIPKKLLSRANLYADSSELIDGQLSVEITATTDSIIIRRASDKKIKWSQERQTNGIIDFIESVKKMPADFEPLPDNFDELYCHGDDDYDSTKFKMSEES